MAIQPLNTSQLLSSLQRADPLRRAAARSATGLPSSNLPEGLRRTSGAAATTLSAENGRALARKAAAAAEIVSSGLKELQAKARLAQQKGYLAGVPDVSRITLQADADLLVQAMDAAVAGAALGGASLVGGDAGAVRIATTALGGSALIAVQPLDSRSLGIDGLDLTTDSGIEAALGRIAAAAAGAAVKTGNVDALAHALDYQDSFMKSLTWAIDGFALDHYSGGYRADGSARSTTGGRGAVLNLLA